MKFRSYVKRICSLLLITIIVFSLNMTVYAKDEVSPTIVVDDVKGTPGSTVSVNVALINNPGVSDIGLKLYFDESIVTLMKLEYNLDFGGTGDQPQNLTSPVKLSWGDLVDQTNDMTLATLTFAINETAEGGSSTDIRVAYSQYDIINSSGNAVDFHVENGLVEVIEGLPGDINGDGTVDRRDLQRARQFFADWDVEVDMIAIDINGDGAVDRRDLQRARQYFADWDVEIFYGEISSKKCVHQTLVKTSEKEATCLSDGNIAYWYCSDCKKYFRDDSGTLEIALENTIIEKTGHTEIDIPDTAPDYGVPGTTGGKICSVCNEITVQPTPVPPLVKNEYFIEFDLAGTDSYLENYLKTADLSKINPNPNKYDTTAQSYAIAPIAKNAIPGYEFVGWEDGYGDPVKTVAQGITGSTTVYAVWNKIEYDIIFDSPLHPISTETRTIDETYYLPQNLEWDHYVFMGWSDASGKIIDKVAPGTKSITVHANWTSNRSLAQANDYLADGPIIVEDENAQKYYFVYDIGMLINVPLETIYDLGYRSSLGIEETVTKTITLGKEEASSLNKVVENATTKSSSWTLSSDWNELLTDITGGEESTVTNQTVALSSGSSTAYNSSGSTYVGESFHTSNDNLTTSKTITDDSWKQGVEAGVEAGYGPIKASVSVSAEQAHSEHQEDYSENKTSMSLDSEWNTTNSFSNSASFQSSQSVSNSVMKSAKDTWQHEISKSVGGSNSETTSGSVSNVEETGYTSSMNFHSVDETQTVEKITSNDSTTPGYYRYVLAGDFYVYAVVTYDVATGAYSVTNHSVLADNTRKTLDYSKNDPLYQDYNNAVLPFEVPIDVHNYVFDALATTEGLIIDRETGIVTDYEGDAKNVFIPDYAIFENEAGTLPTVVKVVGFEADAFANNSNIEKIKFGKYITKIPDGVSKNGTVIGAFENCTNLKYIEYNELTSIGSRAFYGCSSLENFIIDDKVTSIGNNAFDGIITLTVNANKAEVVSLASCSKVENLVVNLNSLTDEFSDTELNINATNSFVLNGYGASFENINLEASADEVSINRITFKDNVGVPLNIESANILLNQVRVENASGLAMISQADSASLTLQGKNIFNTMGDNAILSKSLTVSRKVGVSETTELNVGDKDVLINGALADEKGYLKVEDTTQIKYISDEEFSNMLRSHFVFFDANGGTVKTDKKLVMWNSEYGELPVPTRDYYTFTGWYTAAEGGERVLESTKMAETDVSLYAQWKLNPVSDWVLASSLPDGAEVTDQKWTYTLTENTTSTSSSLSGWTQTGWKWKQTKSGTHYYSSFPGGFDTGNSLYSKYNKSALSAYGNDNTDTKRVVSSASFNTYIYWHWNYTDCGNVSAQNRTISDQYTSKYNHFAAFETTSNYGHTDSKGYTCDEYFCNRGVEWDISWWWFRFNTYKQTYTDYQKQYSFTKHTSHESSSPVTEASGISNIQEWVQYRAK